MIEILFFSAMANLLLSVQLFNLYQLCERIKADRRYHEASMLNSSIDSVKQQYESECG